MDNISVNVAEVIMPPRADFAPKRANRPSFAANVDRNPVDGPGRNVKSTHAGDEKGHVSSGQDSEKQDFNRVLEGKIGKSGSSEKKGETEQQDSENNDNDQLPPGILVADTKVSENVVNKQVSPLINYTNAKQDSQSSKAAASVEVVPENALTADISKSTSNGDTVTPVEKIPANPENVTPETARIPVKTIEQNPQTAAKPEVEIVKSEPKIQNQQSAPETGQNQQPASETDQPVLKTMTKNENLAADQKISQAEKPVEHTGAEKLVTQNKAAAQAKPENTHEDSEYKLSKVMKDTKPAGQTNVSDTDGEVKITADKSVLPVANQSAGKQIRKDLPKESTGQIRIETTGEGAGNIEGRNIIETSGRMDVKPQSVNIVSQVTDKISTSMITAREQISIALDPPELGRVMIRFQQNNGEIVGIIQADKTRTHQEIAEEMPVIVRALNENGVAVKRVEVILTEQETQDAASENSTNQNNNTGRDDLSGGSDNQNNRGSAAGLPNLSGQYNPVKNADKSVNTLSDDAINMYA